MQPGAGSRAEKGYAVKKIESMDYLFVGVTLAVGMAEAAHLAALFSGWSFGTCSGLFLGAAGIGILCFAGAGIRALVKGSREERGIRLRLPERVEGILWGITGFLFLSQLVFLCLEGAFYRRGDIMVETVGSFLDSDGIYRVNPLTGNPYREGLPLRLKILCLPTLYGSLCRLTGLEPWAVVRRVVPVLTLFGCFGALGLLGRSLFPEDSDSPVSGRRKRACFMLVAALLLWVESSARGTEGFCLLYCGAEGTTIRNCVLMPWLFSLCIRRKWGLVPLCILAEACITWTFYGLGACAAVAAGMALAGLGQRIFLAGLKGGRKSGREL